MRHSAALSLRNLVSGQECGRVFPAGVEPGSPSTDAANWLSSRFSRSVKARRRYGWLRTVFQGSILFGAAIWCPSGGGGTREAGSIVAESLAALYQMDTHRIRRGRRAARWPTSQGSAEPLCAIIKGANREVSEGKTFSDHGLISSYEGRQGATNGQDSWGVFRDAQGYGRLDTVSCAGFISSRPPPPWTSVL